jgi:hypothetical protein
MEPTWSARKGGLPSFVIKILPVVGQATGELSANPGSG